MYATIFLLIFATAVVIYGFAMQRTGSRDLLPYRSSHSVRNKQQVRQVGAIVMRVGGVMIAILTAVLLAQLLT